MDDREQQRKVRHRLAILRHAEEVSGNVAATCRYYGISRAPRTEASVHSAVIDAARLFGWRVAHFRPAQRRDGVWMTPVATDGAGFPDHVLVRDRVVFAELKSSTGRLRPAQSVWLDALRTAGAEPYVWRPEDSDEIVEVLR